MTGKDKIKNAPISVQIDLKKGLMSPYTVRDQRFVSNLLALFYDQAAGSALIEQGNPLVYEIYHHAFLTDRSDMALGMSIIAAGKVGKEYFMTKGHVHERDDQAELYHCVQGEGLLLMDDLGEDFVAMPFNQGTVIHIPPQYAHRVVNTGSEALIFVSSFHVSAGHSYYQVQERGFAKIVVEENGKPTLLANPRRLEKSNE